MERMGINEDLHFYAGKTVLVTGHTGFKGSWLCQILLKAGASVTGYALGPPTSPSLFALCGLQNRLHDVRGDVRDFAHLSQTLRACRPDIVFHLAAQPLVRESYAFPRETYETNVMGTVNLLEGIRALERPPLSVLNVTTDKVYDNREWVWGYREDERLQGFDPYSNSKSCSELVTQTYRDCFFAPLAVPISTARAGNVIGGGDFSKDRILPDCIRAAQKGQPILVRHPDSVRPYQHVLDPLFAYLRIARLQAEDPSLAGSYNVGPDDSGCVTTGKLAESFCRAWGEGAAWESRPEEGPHEANFLRLDCSKIRAALGWRPRWDIYTAVEKTVQWSKACLVRGEDPAAYMEQQIEEFITT